MLGPNGLVAAPRLCLMLPSCRRASDSALLHRNRTSQGRSAATGIDFFQIGCFKFALFAKF